ncbi:MAG: (2Fe-2S)-binding protein [Acidimicrobiia bacterium]
MWVCLCKGVNDRQIRAVINAGARTPEEIADRCRATTGCGGCLPEVCRLLDDCLAARNYLSEVECEPVGVAAGQT